MAFDKSRSLVLSGWGSGPRRRSLLFLQASVRNRVDKGFESLVIVGQVKKGAGVGGVWAWNGAQAQRNVWRN